VPKHDPGPFASVPITSTRFNRAEESFES
jgi:hypothetical protein